MNAAKHANKAFEIVQRRQVWAFWSMLIALACVASLATFVLAVYLSAIASLDGTLAVSGAGLLAAGVVVTAVRYGQRNQPRADEVLFVVRAFGEELQWGPTGLEHRVLLDAIAKAVRVDGPGDFVYTELRMKDGQVINIGSEFGSHTQLVNTLNRLLENRRSASEAEARGPR